MTITSTAFLHNERIPAEHTCDGANINPPLTFSETPTDAKSLLLLVDDPDAPAGLFTHWLLYDMSPATLQILEEDAPETGTNGTNDTGKLGYAGPCPPSGTHRYFFKLFALKSMLNLPEGANRQEVDAAMEGQVLGSAELIGLYERAGESSKTLANENLSDYTDDRNTSDGQMLGNS